MPTPIRFLRPDQREVEMLHWSEQDLDELAQISPDDKQRATAYWRRLLPRRLRDLLDARGLR